MAECKDCYNGCTISTFDKCVRYTGDDNSVLDICNGDGLDEVIDQLIANLAGYSTGEGITISLPTTPCTYLANKLSSDFSLSNILTAYYEAICELNAGIDDINDGLTNVYTFNTSCLTVAAGATRDDILQATITKTCANTASISTILADYVKASQLNTLIQQYLDTIEEAPSTVVQQNTKMVPFVAYEYYGTLSYFDSSGKGLSASGYEKIYLCNGSNGTPDKRGRVAVGVNVGIPGGSMDALVDPAGANNVQVTLKKKIGEFKHANSIDENGPHSHSATETDHFHYIFSNIKAEGGPVTSTGFTIRESGGANSAYSIKGNTQYTPSVGRTSSTHSTITVSSSGAGKPHNNTQPSIGAYYIMYIP